MSEERKAESIFREQALQYWQSRGDEFVLLRVDPSWMDNTYRLLIAFALLSFAYILFGRMNEYASGPAIVLLQGQQEVTAKVEGVVRTLNVKPGQPVTPGTELMHLNDDRERAELDRVQKELDLTLTRVFRNPADAARDTLSALQASRVAAQARLDAMIIKAPAAGIVRELRIREGQHVEQGNVVATLGGTEEVPTVMVLMPGHARPRLNTDTAIRLELKGYPFVFLPLTIESIGEDVITAKEAMRYLGSEAAESLKLEDSVVLVRAKPHGATFSFNGDQYSLYHGMAGRGECRLRRERVLFALFPALRLLGRGP